MKKTLIIAVMMPLMASAGLAAAWSHYANDRYGYAIDIPPGFSEVAESGNNDGGVSTSPDGRTELRVWGAYLLDRSFAEEIAWRVEQDKADGWQVSYDRRLARAASWSGSRGERIFYRRSVMGCDGAAYYFNLEYDRDALKANDAIVRHLVKSLRSGC